MANAAQRANSTNEPRESAEQTSAGRPSDVPRTRVFRKSGPNLPGEAVGLRWLAEAQSAGGASVAEVLSVSPEQLELEYIESAPPTADRARRFGRALAHTHAAGAEWWGCAPPSWTGPAYLGNSRTPLVLDPSAAPATWGEFYADYRIANFARQVAAKGLFSSSDVAVFDRLTDRLRAGDFDAPQPALVRAAGHDVARVHGDMWAGNVLYDNSETGATLIDPLAHGGHGETDLATLTVFGFPHLEEVYAGYHAESPLAVGWRERIALHQLGIVIMHADLFGGGYAPRAVALARQYV